MKRPRIKKKKEKKKKDNNKNLANQTYEAYKRQPVSSAIKATRRCASHLLGWLELKTTMKKKTECVQ